jgi:hypothetical protein
MWAAGGRRRGDGGRRERRMVPDADFRSYYGRQVLQTPVWQVDIPLYYFVGGLAAGSSLLAAGADLTGTSPALRRSGRVAAVAGVTASAGFLIRDLGRPARFHHMLRVVKPSSPMSVGTWLLTAYGPLAAVAAGSEGAALLPPGRLHDLLPAAGRAAGLAAAALAPAVASYTAVLTSNTTVPSWHDAWEHLPLVFVGSAAAAAGGLGLLAAPLPQAWPARRLAVAGAALDLLAARRMESRMGLTGEPYSEGEAGRWMAAAQVLTAGGAALAVAGRRSRGAGAVAGAALLAGSLATRMGVFRAGVASTRDPKYVVVPQRERLRAAGAP